MTESIAANDFSLSATAGRPLRVVYITPGGTEGRGGMGMMARYLLQAFNAAESGIECRVIDSYGPGKFVVMPIYFLAASFQLVCRLHRTDIVHLHMSHEGSAVRKLTLLLLASAFGVPTILHVHGSRFAVFVDRLSPFPRWMLLMIMRRATRIAVIGTYWQRLFTDRLGFAPGRVVTIHNGVPMPAPIDRNGRDRTCKILCLGLLGERKGTSDLLQALASPDLSELPWRAVIAGNGDVVRYQQEAKRLGLSGRVDLPGWVGPDAVKRLLEESDIFILPSYNEGLPVALLEAMAAGLAVITTPVGAIPDLVTHRETGVLVEPGAIASLSAEIASLVRDNALRLRLGDRACAAVRARFTVQATVNKLVALYEGARQGFHSC